MLISVFEKKESFVCGKHSKVLISNNCKSKGNTFKPVLKDLTLSQNRSLHNMEACYSV